MELYKAGFVGGSVVDSTEWMAEQASGAKTVCVPFAGIGRSTLAMLGADPDKTIWSWDTQHYTYCIFNGVFKAQEPLSNVDRIRYRKGWAYENRPLKNMDDRSAGFIDWVAGEGTLFDKAALGSAIVRSTLMGRMSHWKSNVEGLYDRFERAKAYNTDWLNQPGNLVHYEADFFKEMPPEDRVWDLMMVDPPKVVNYSDVYSLHFNGLNKALTCGQAGNLPRWGRRSVVPSMRQVMKVKSRKMILMYVSKVVPTYADMKKLLAPYGEFEDELEFNHNGRTDYGLLINREGTL